MARLSIYISNPVQDGQIPISNQEKGAEPPALEGATTKAPSEQALCMRPCSGAEQASPTKPATNDSSSLHLSPTCNLFNTLLDNLPTYIHTYSLGSFFHSIELMELFVFIRWV